MEAATRSTTFLAATSTALTMATQVTTDTSTGLTITLELGQLITGISGTSWFGKTDTLNLTEDSKR